MQSAIASKFTLYDILSMIVPGSMIIGAMLLWGNIVNNHDNSIGVLTLLRYNPSGIELFVFAILSYIAGIINWQLSDLFWSGFINNPIEIKNWRRAIYFKNSPRLCLKYHYCISSKYIAISFAVYYLLANCIVMTFVLMAISLVCLIVQSLKSKNYSINKAVENYFKCYYFVERSRPNNSIKVIENQVAFLKSMCLPICLCFAVILRIKQFQNHSVEIILVGLSILFAIVAVASKRQNVIYRIVLEDYKYLNKNNNIT